VAIAFTALLAAGGEAQAQAVFKCTTPKGTVSYQEMPCTGTTEQKRVGTAPGAAEDAAARGMLEREARRGDPLASGFVDELRERERQEQEERLRREREKPARPVVEEPEWMPPWGWAGPPGLARPKPTPAK
jgi:hypothetical protein